MKAKVRPPGNTTYDYLIVIDFEATCQENNLNYNHEIIEFPAVLVDCHSREIVRNSVHVHVFTISVDHFH